jgi:hypothetical protein
MQQLLTFTPEGFLTPFEKINVDLATFERAFVADFPCSETRKTLFDNYLRYIDNFSKEITPNFTQWIDGSFVSQKENPNDIDLVTFISGELYTTKQAEIEKFWTTNTYHLGLDAFIMSVFEKQDTAYSQYITYYNEWIERFSRTRKDENGNHFNKGFIAVNLNFENGKITS